jgi:hypothetical protein
MKITVRISRARPSVDPQLLVRFALKKISQVKAPSRTEPPAIWIALVLAAVADDLAFYNRFREEISSSSASADKILGMSDTLFMPALGRFPYEYLSDCLNENPKYLFPDERTCRGVLRHAVREGRKMLAGQIYESMKEIFQVLTRAGLQSYSFRLAQFEDICESFRDDPENLVRKGLEIIKVAAYQPRKKK